MCGEKIIVFVSYFNPCEPNVRQEASEDHLFFTNEPYSEVN